MTMTFIKPNSKSGYTGGYDFVQACAHCKYVAHFYGVRHICERCGGDMEMLRAKWETRRAPNWRWWAPWRTYGVWVRSAHAFNGHITADDKFFAEYIRANRFQRYEESGKVHV